MVWVSDFFESRFERFPFHPCVEQEDFFFLIFKMSRFPLVQFVIPDLVTSAVLILILLDLTYSWQSWCFAYFSYIIKYLRYFI